jgi:hypothetical protein
MVFVRNFIVCAALAADPHLASSQEIQAAEYRVKAAFLYNFTKLVEWPTNAFATDKSPLIVGVLGKDPFGKELDDLTTGRTVNGHPLQTMRFRAVEQITNCHILFICESARRKLDSILDALRDKPILTVSDMKGFEARGMITLIRSNDSINLHINLAAARDARLRLSSRLIRLDRSLHPTDERRPPVPAPKTK